MLDLEMLDAEFVGDLSDTVTDYDYGEKQVIQLRAFYESLGKPVEFKSALDAINAAYDSAKAWEPFGIKDKLLRWKNSTEMKQVGADASRLMAALQDAHRTKSATVPSSSKSDVYDPNAPGLTTGLTNTASSVRQYLPWIIGGVALVAVGGVVGPVVGPLLAARAARAAVRR